MRPEITTGVWDRLGDGPAGASYTLPSVTAAGSAFGIEMLAALSQRPRRIAPKFFYDEAGSALFDRICDLPEYYPTRTEFGLLHAHAGEMASLIGPAADIVEFGAGSLTKIRVLLDALPRPRRFVPVDISAEHLHASAVPLRRAYPGLEVLPLAGDFTAELALPASGHRIGFFPGSSIGNMDRDEALAFLRRCSGWLRGGGLLIGVDLVKDPRVLHAAYNDSAGVTAAFNRNLLVRANRELGTDFVPEQFAHYAYYDPAQRRIEMHLVSRCKQRVHLGGREFTFAEGESLHTENSHKYTVADFRSLAAEAGFEPRAVWSDAQGRFSVHWLVAPPA